MKFKKHILSATFLLLVFVFSAGMLIGRNLETRNSKLMSDFIKENELNTESYLIEQELIKDFGEDSCVLAEARIEDLSKELGNIGTRLSGEDARETLGQENYEFLKKKFHLMQIKTYILFKKLIDQCNIPSNIVLYYYSIDDEDSQEQGKVLDKIVEDYNAKVFAIEFDYSEELVFLESYYKITETPSIVVNYAYLHEGFVNYDNIVNEMKE